MRPCLPHDPECEITLLLFRIRWLTSPTHSHLRPPSSMKMNLLVSSPVGPGPGHCARGALSWGRCPVTRLLLSLPQMPSRSGLCSTVRCSRWTSGRGAVWKATAPWCCPPPQVTSRPCRPRGPHALAAGSETNAPKTFSLPQGGRGITRN